MAVKLVRKPAFYFFLQAVLLAAAFAVSGRFEPVRVGDTPTYEDFPFQSLDDALRHPRTFAYPLFLKAADVLAPGHRAAPVLTFLCHIVAVCVFWQGAQRVIRSPWTSMAVASSLLYSNIVLRYTSDLAGDALASSLAIACVGLLSIALFGSRRRLAFAALAVCVFATYQVRPAYLFLLPLLPLLGLSLLWLVSPGRRQMREWIALAGVLLAVVLLPYVVFCTVRWQVTGYSSLVSFGGNNFSAVVCMFLTEEDVPALSPEVRPLAEEVVRRRQQIAAQDPDYTAEATRRYMAIERPFDTNIVDVCVPAAEAVVGDDWPEVDRALWRLAFAIVRHKPGDYAVWLAKAFVRGVYMVVSEYVMNPVYFLLIAVLAIAHACSVVLRKYHGQKVLATEPTFFVEFNALLLIALSFALAKVMLVIITSPPLGRFIDAAGIFFACVLMRALVERVELCRRVRRSASPH